MTLLAMRRCSSVLLLRTVGSGVAWLVAAGFVGVPCSRCGAGHGSTAMSAVCVNSIRTKNLKIFNWREKKKKAQWVKRRTVCDGIKRAATSGNASVAVSTDTHTSAVALQELPVDDRHEKWQSHVTGIGIQLPRNFCREIPFAYVLILDGHAVAAKVAEALDPCI